MSCFNYAFDQALTTRDDKNTSEIFLFCLRLSQGIFLFQGVWETAFNYVDQLAKLHSTSNSLHSINEILPLLQGHISMFSEFSKTGSEAVEIKVSYGARIEGSNHHSLDVTLLCTSLLKIASDVKNFL